ncbi:hypothetical protein CBL_20044 [Carabus blaptoides fortunei]
MRMLRDKIVTGIHRDEVREKLLAEPQLHLERAILIRRNCETASRQVQNANLNELIQYITKNWPNQVRDLPMHLRQYWTYRDELSYYDGVIAKVYRALILKALRPSYLEIIHQGHLGIQSNLNRARESQQRDNDREPIKLHQIPDYTWQMVATDLFEIKQKTYTNGSDITLALLNSRNTPRRDLKLSAIRMFGRSTQNLVPSRNDVRKEHTTFQQELEKQRLVQKSYADRICKGKQEFETGDHIRVQIGHRNWTHGSVISQDVHPRSVNIQIDENYLYRRNHQDAHKTVAKFPSRVEEVPDIVSSPESTNWTSTEVVRDAPKEVQQCDDNIIQPDVPPLITRSGRTNRPPQRFDLYFVLFRI